MVLPHESPSENLSQENTERTIAVSGEHITRVSWFALQPFVNHGPSRTGTAGQQGHLEKE